MKALILMCIAAVILAACGVDGEPLTPRFSGETNVGFTSNSGPFSDTSLVVSFGN